MLRFVSASDNHICQATISRKIELYWVCVKRLHEYQRDIPIELSCIWIDNVVVYYFECEKRWQRGCILNFWVDSVVVGIWIDMRSFAIDFIIIFHRSYGGEEEMWVELVKRYSTSRITWIGSTSASPNKSLTSGEDSLFVWDIYDILILLLIDFERTVVELKNSISNNYHRDR